jgi:hypothetical protein
MDYALIGTIARVTNSRPNWDREVTRAVSAARACAIAVLIRAVDSGGCRNNRGNIIPLATIPK